MKLNLPEGKLADTKEMKAVLKSERLLREAHLKGEILEARPLVCDAEHNLHFDFGVARGFMPRTQCAEGISEGTVRDIAIISRVNKPTRFIITDIMTDSDLKPLLILSRVKVQKEFRNTCLTKLRSGDVISCKITHLAPFGAFCDIGSGVVALLPVDSISVSRIPGPDTRFNVGDEIKAVLKNIADDGKITLSMKELLGTWQENAELFKAGETVTGIIRSKESYGIFVELMPNLAGLCENSEDVKVGCGASVFIKSINPEKMKIKLNLVEADTLPAVQNPIKYFVNAEHIDYWEYSPENAVRKISTSF